MTVLANASHCSFLPRCFCTITISERVSVRDALIVSEAQRDWFDSSMIPDFGSLQTDSAMERKT